MVSMTLTALDQLKFGKIELGYRKKTQLRPRLCTFREEYSVRSWLKGHRESCGAESSSLNLHRKGQRAPQYERRLIDCVYA